MQIRNAYLITETHFNRLDEQCWLFSFASIMKLRNKLLFLESSFGCFCALKIILVVCSLDTSSLCHPLPVFDDLGDLGP